jgi:hypothetical protein
MFACGWSLMETRFEPRAATQAGQTLLAFYEAVFDDSVVAPIPTRFEVADLDATLARVWDFGGTIVSVAEPSWCDEYVTRATVRDPSGTLVTLVQPFVTEYPLLSA